MKHKILKLLSIIITIIIILLIGSYFIFTSNYFIKNYILPSIGKSFNERLTAESVDISLLSGELKLNNILLGTEDKPVLKSERLICDFSLKALIGGTLKISKFDFDNTYIDLVIDKNKHAVNNELEENKGSNVEKTTNTKSTPSVFNLDISNFYVKNLNANILIRNEDDSSNNIKLSNFDISVPSLRTDNNSVISYTGKLNFSGKEMNIDAGKVSGKINIVLDKFIQPNNLDFESLITSISGKLHKTNVKKHELKLSLKLNKEGHSYKLNKALFLELNREQQVKSSLSVSGYIDESLNNFKIAISANPISSNLINIVGALAGNYNFGKALLKYDGSVEQIGSIIKSKGKLVLNNVTVSSPSLVKPIDSPFNLNMGYQISADKDNETISVNDLNLKNFQNGTNNILIESVKPFNVTWKDGKTRFINSKPELVAKIRNFNLDIVNLFIPSEKGIKVLSGRLSTNLKTELDNSVAKIRTNGNIYIYGLALKIKDQLINKVGLESFLDINVNDFNNIIINKISSKLTKDNDKVTAINLAGNYSLEDMKGNLKLTIPYLTNRILSFIPEKQLTREGNAELIKQITPFNASYTSDITIDLKSSTFKLNSTKFDFVSGKNGTIKIKEVLPLYISYKKAPIKFLEPSVFKINIKFLPLAPFSAFIDEKKSFIINDGELNGNYTIQLDNKDNSVKAIESTTIADLSYTSNGKLIKNLDLNNSSKIEYYFYGTEKKVKINNLKLTINSDTKRLADANVNGTFPIPTSSGKSKVTVVSEFIDLKSLQEILKGHTSNVKQTEVNEQVRYDDQVDNGAGNTQQKEPKALDLNGLNLTAKVNLKKIGYGEYIDSSLLSVIDIVNNTISIKPCVLNINNTPINSSAYLNGNFKDGYLYNVSSDFSNLDLNPILKTLVQGHYSKTKGKIDKFHLKIQGKGFTQSNLDKNLKGVIQSSLSDLSLPNELEKYQLFAILMLPLQVFSQVDNLLPQGTLTTNLLNISNSTQDFFDTAKNINFKNGLIDIYIDNGKVDFKQFDLNGNPVGLINYMKFRGYIGLDKSIRLTTNSKIAGVSVPLEIQGTISKPEPNTGSFIQSFTAENAANLLKPENIQRISNIVDKAATGSGNAVDKTTGIISDILGGSQQEQSSNSAISDESQNSNTLNKENVGKVVNGVRNIFNF